MDWKRIVFIFHKVEVTILGRQWVELRKEVAMLPSEGIGKNMEGEKELDQENGQKL
ncbi:MAG: hypothetical protein JRJ29_02810 [Deltaproteobacteria bacterium]|nr:hypothetical protein [Deltaproteobacteria bacterium]